MGTPAEQSTTEENRGAGVTEAPAEQVAPQSDPDAELARLEDRWRRAVADLDNLRKRYARELGRGRAVERGRVAAARLPVRADHARPRAHAEADPGAILAGVQAVRDQAVALLAALGYPRQDQ